MQLKGATALSSTMPGGRQVHYGIREFAMGTALTGMALHGGIVPIGATFFVFSDYMRSAIRVAAISKAPARYFFSHDSIGVGQDGPTHQPVDQLASLRAIPGSTSSDRPTRMSARRSSTRTSPSTVPPR